MYGPPWSPTCEKQCNLRPCLSFSEAAGAGSRSPRKGLIYGVLRLSGRIHVVEPSEHQVIFDNVRDRGDPQSKASINELMSVLGSVGPWMLLEDLGASAKDLNIALWFVFGNVQQRYRSIEAESLYETCDRMPESRPLRATFWPSRRPILRSVQWLANRGRKGGGRARVGALCQ
ncbi:unnamed protein product [Durusdinium trenchii]|uniref:Uncharacterized protein n=1 Tax=Durusdinium trenchii TaxID=1381693 RepID=A0ABP0S9G7_9DINO